MDIKLNGYFITGDNPSRVNTSVPNWISLTKQCFNFTEDIFIPSQMKSFKDVIPTFQQFTEKEIEICCFQYRNLLKPLRHKGWRWQWQQRKHNQSEVHSLPHTPALYSGYELALTVMLDNICVAVSECGIESLISTIAQSNSSSCPLSLSQLESEVNIRKNGPHPLRGSEEKFLYDTLCRHFGGDTDK